MARISLLVAYMAFLCACSDRTEQYKNKDISEVAGNEEVLKYMKAFEGRGDLSDTAHMVDAKEAVKQFKIPSDLAVDLVLAEPAVTQPVFITFDPQGRLWVVQYNQYPYPEGLKVLSVDWHNRAKFDKEPLPPPSNVKGADKITMFEDTDGDGSFDKSTDVITGLNLITSVAFGRGQIWVLNPPYLLAYPDADNNGIPDGKPVVRLKGFGIEDTHAVANNLKFGPDGWLYGAQGSTCNANISSEVSKDVKFLGQAIWRYHPDTKVFEVFAEGGGNTFDVEIDSKGRLYSGDNGTSRGEYFKQGSYFVRNLGKHGEYTNQYTYGHLPNMQLTGEEVRFTHAFVRYEGASLPGKYNDYMIALNPLQSYVQLTKFEPNGSTFKTIDEERIMVTDDHWFRPVDITTGPDGNVYIADWYDSRISHIDPRDTWNKNSGRIYRLKNRAAAQGKPEKFDLYKSSDEQLVTLLSHKNNWYRQAALQVLADRKNKSLLPSFKQMLQGNDATTSLEALWAIHLTGGFNDEISTIALSRSDPFVRMWAVRLIGDGGTPTNLQSDALTKLSLNEANAEVRSQLAASAKRLTGSVAIPIIKNLLQKDDSQDPDIPLQTWWAIESKCISDRDALVGLFEDKNIWKNNVVSKTILNRLVQRYISSGNDENVAACARLFNLAPSEQYAGILFGGVQEGLRGRDVTELSPVLAKALAPYKKLFREQSLAIDLHTGKKEAVEKAIQILNAGSAPLPEQISYIRIMGEVAQPEAAKVLVDLAESSASGALKQACLLALQNYSADSIGDRVAKFYPDKLRDDYDVRESAMAFFASRPGWAQHMLNAITQTHAIEKNDVPDHAIRQIKLLGNEALNKQCESLWPGLDNTSAEQKNKLVDRVNKAVKSGVGNQAAGHPLFIAKCGTCHKLFDEGRSIAPDLTGYDRKNIADMVSNIVDPSAYIREGYGTWHLTTNDGRTVIGTLKARNDQSVTLQPFTGEPVSIASNKIRSLEAMETSMMPEKLLDALNDQKVRDLFSYLMK